MEIIKIIFRQQGIIAEDVHNQRNALSSEDLSWFDDRFVFYDNFHYCVIKILVRFWTRIDPQIQI
jgi:hypothetical protein